MLICLFMKLFLETFWFIRYQILDNARLLFCFLGSRYRYIDIQSIMNLRFFFKNLKSTILIVQRLRKKKYITSANDPQYIQQIEIGVYVSIFNMLISYILCCVRLLSYAKFKDFFN